LKGKTRFKLLNMLKKTPYFLGLDLNIDSPSRTLTTVPAAESIDASRPAGFLADPRHFRTKHLHDHVEDIVKSWIPDRG